MEKTFSEILELLEGDFGFELLSEKKYGSSSKVTILSNKKVKIKMISEKRQFFVEVGSFDSSFWTELSLIRYYIDKNEIDYMDALQILEYLKANFSKIQSVYSEKKNLELLDKLKYNYANKLPI